MRTLDRFAIIALSLTVCVLAMLLMHRRESAAPVAEAPFESMTKDTSLIIRLVKMLLK